MILVVVLERLFILKGLLAYPTCMGLVATSTQLAGAALLLVVSGLCRHALSHGTSMPCSALGRTRGVFE